MPNVGLFTVNGSYLSISMKTANAKMPHGSQMTLKSYTVYCKSFEVEKFCGMQN